MINPSAGLAGCERGGMASAALMVTSTNTMLRLTIAVPYA
jgi:hypothetical protein